MKELIMPDTKKLQSEYLVNYGKEFLRLNDLNVGDEVDLEFDYDTLKSAYKKRELQKYTYKKVSKGILKLDENSFLYAESIDDFTFYWQANVFGKWKWQSETRKSIKRFGTGFIY